MPPILYTSGVFRPVDPLDNPNRTLLPLTVGAWASVRKLGSRSLELIIRMSTTKANYWAEAVVSGSLSTCLLANGARLHRGPWLAAFFTVLAGLVAFSFIEYVFHRWIFHGPESMYRRGHDAHHANPQGYDALPFFLPAAILLGLTAIFWCVMPVGHACLLGGTIAFGYVAYGLSHYTIHATRFRQPWLRHWAAGHHIHHHHAHSNFGVTSSLWDHVLGTRYRSARDRRTQSRIG